MFGILYYSFLQIPQLPLLLIHPPLLPFLASLPHLSVVCLEIYCLSVDQRVSEYLTVGGLGLGGVCDTSFILIHTPVDTLSEGVSDLLYPYP